MLLNFKVQFYIFSLLMLSSEVTHAACNRLWAQADVGFGGSGVLLKADCDPLDLAAGVIRYEKIDWFTHYSDRAGGRHEPSIRVYSVMKMWNRPLGRGVVDVGLGIGYAEGEWFKNCGDEPGLLFGGKVCGVKDVSSLGIPLHASAAVGKGFGVGLVRIFF